MGPTVHSIELWRFIRKSLRASLLGCTLVACAGLGSAERGVGAGHILLGQSLPLSGPLATIARAYSDGAAAQFAAVNAAGGVHGRRIELITLDDRQDTQRALANTRELLYAHQVFALVNYFGAEIHRALSPIVQAERVPFIAPQAHHSLASAAYHRYFFAVAGAPADAANGETGAWARGHSDAEILIEALRGAGRDLSREKLVATLEQLEYSRLSGRQVAFAPSHRSESASTRLTFTIASR